MKETVSVEEVPTSPSGVRHRVGRVRFFAARERIRADLEKGYSLIVIYERHRADLQFSYSQFSRYVAQFLTHPIPEHYPWGTSRKRREEPREAPAADSRREASAGQPRFKFRRDTPRESLI